MQEVYNSLVGDTAGKPLLIYDGRCGFCKIWIDYWKELTADAVAYATSQDAGTQYSQIEKKDFGRSVQLVLPDGEVVRGARAVYQTLAYDRAHRWPLALYDHLPGFAPISELAYRVIAANRNFAYHATVLLFGRVVHRQRYDAVQWLFRTLLAVIWLIAFVSFGVQAAGLIGSHGVQPVGVYLARVGQILGPGAWHSAPTLFWLRSGDEVVRGVCIAGALAAVLAIAGVFWRGALCVCFVLYLSLVNASQEFLSYQWDILLLETGFLAIFLGYSRVVIWLFRWLLFRLMFLSGAVKLLSGDPTWRSLSALMVHYQTQPIPTPLAWYANQLPAWFQRVSCLLVFFIELAVPFLIFAPRRARRFAIPWLIGLQLLIILTGNYAFFNWLAILLCVFLVDDVTLLRSAPHGLTKFASRPVRSFVPARVRTAVSWSVGVVVGLLSTFLVIQTLRFNLPAAARSLTSAAAPFGITSSYGLFAMMTTTRPEIIVEGSNDGSNWQAYEFRYKPGRLDRSPPWVAPHQPRLDWQMWFAALGNYQENVWFLNMLARFLQGTPEVLAFIERNPFPDHPPKLVRALVYEYRFTDWNTRRNSGNVWTRTPLGTYVPPVSLEALSDLPILKHERSSEQR